MEEPAFLSFKSKPTAGFSTRILRLLARNDNDFYAEIASPAAFLRILPLKPKDGLNGHPAASTISSYLINTHRFNQKLEVAAELIPTALRPGGVNPLGQLYKHASIGLHGKTDDECVAIFDDLRADFEYVFRNLHNQAQERREFARRVKQRASNEGA